MKLKMKSKIMMKKMKNNSNFKLISKIRLIIVINKMMKIKKISIKKENDNNNFHKKRNQKKKLSFKNNNLSRTIITGNILVHQLLI